MDQWLGATLAARRFTLRLVEVFAVAALLLAAIGVYAVSASAVAARTREIGIRAALGASRREIVALVLRGGMAPVLLGLAAGGLAAPFAGRTVAGMLFGVTARDPLSTALVMLILAAAALVASCVPARRATRVDPLIALQSE
jgi:putative ABC transport system permease protein